MSNDDFDIEPVKRGPGRPRKTDTAVQKKVMRIDELPPLPDENEDRLYIPPEIVPEGMRYQWVTDSVYGKSYQDWRARRERRGFTPVMAERHDGMFMPKGYQGEINVDGLVLMERHEAYCVQSERNDLRKAKEQVWAKEQQLRGGDIPNVTGADDPRASRQNRIGKTYERVPIPED